MKQYLVIGASSGIGAKTAEILAQKNEVWATFNKHEKESQEKIHFHPLNVLDEDLDLSFLPDQLDGVVYCPGSINLMPFKRISPDKFREDYELQVIGAVKILQEVLPKLKNADHPSIVLFSTVAVQSGFNFHAQVAASKGALEGLTKSLSAEWAPKIRVNAIAPSLTDTPLAESLLNSDKKREANANRHPLKTIGTAADIAEMTAFLLSDKSKWITGQIIHVDGGMSTIRG